MRFPRLRGIPGSSSWSSREIFGLAVPSVLIARHRKIGSLPQFVALPRQCLAPRCKTLHEWPQQSPSARPPSAICPVHRCHCAPSPRDQMRLAPAPRPVDRYVGVPGDLQSARPAETVESTPDHISQRVSTPAPLHRQTKSESAVESVVA